MTCPLDWRIPMTALAIVWINDVEEARVVAVLEAMIEVNVDDANVDEANDEPASSAANEVMVELADIHAVVLEAKLASDETWFVRPEICAVKSAIEVELLRVAVVLDRALT